MPERFASPPQRVLVDLRELEHRGGELAPQQQQERLQQQQRQHLQCLLRHGSGFPNV